MPLTTTLHLIHTKAWLAARAGILWLKQKEFRTLVGCEELQSVEREIAQRNGLPLVPCHPFVADKQEQWLKFAGLTHKDVTRWLTSDRERLIDFCVAVHREFRNDNRD